MNEGMRKIDRQAGGCRQRKSSQQDDLRFSGPPSCRGADSGAEIRDRRVPADLRADSLATVPPASLVIVIESLCLEMVHGPQANPKCQYQYQRWKSNLSSGAFGNPPFFPFSDSCALRRKRKDRM
ncbi:hypothetical protein PoB_000229100 [Plakobranchus ocellatus]|uniref:Uncharacterized protein n=1 Tax=Plakobranchus ocellatus TaxID=259542 RepID=A0AAV3X8Y8_9GAST|nr:hypothetical protein PoB_000229100 [Plakobranchus ocellatus]